MFGGNKLQKKHISKIIFNFKNCIKKVFFFLNKRNPEKNNWILCVFIFCSYFKTFFKTFEFQVTNQYVILLLKKLLLFFSNENIFSYDVVL